MEGDDAAGLPSIHRLPTRLFTHPSALFRRIIVLCIYIQLFCALDGWRTAVAALPVACIVLVHVCEMQRSWRDNAARIELAPAPLCDLVPADTAAKSVRLHIHHRCEKAVGRLLRSPKPIASKEASRLRWPSFQAECVLRVLYVAAPRTGRLSRSTACRPLHLKVPANSAFDSLVCRRAIAGKSRSKSRVHLVRREFEPAGQQLLCCLTTRKRAKLAITT
jgi:hypothetical protein